MSAGDKKYDVELSLRQTGDGDQQAIDKLHKVGDVAQETGAKTAAASAEGSKGLSELGKAGVEAGHGLREGAHGGELLARALTGETIGVRTLIMGVRALWAVMLANPITAVVAALAGMGIVLFELAKKHREAAEKIKEDQKGIQEAIAATVDRLGDLEEASGNLAGAIAEAARLREEYKGAADAADALREAQDKLKSAQERLALDKIERDRAQAIKDANGDPDKIRIANRDADEQKANVELNFEREKAQSDREKAAAELERNKAGLQADDEEQRQIRNAHGDVVDRTQDRRRDLFLAGIKSDERLKDPKGVVDDENYSVAKDYLKQQLDDAKTKKQPTDHIQKQLDLIADYEKAKTISDADFEKFSKRDSEITADKSKLQQQQPVLATNLQAADTTLQTFDVQKATTAAQETTKEQDQRRADVEKKNKEIADEKVKSAENEIQALDNEIAALDKDDNRIPGLIKQRADLEKKLLQAQNDKQSVDGTETDADDTATALKQAKAAIDAKNQANKTTDEQGDRAWDRATKVAKAEQLPGGRGGAGAGQAAPMVAAFDLHADPGAAWWADNGSAGAPGASSAGGSGSAPVVAAIQSTGSAQADQLSAVKDAVQQHGDTNLSLIKDLVKIVQDQGRELEQLKSQTQNQNNR